MEIEYLLVFLSGIWLVLAVVRLLIARSEQRVAAVLGIIVNLGLITTNLAGGINNLLFNTKELPDYENLYIVLGFLQLGIVAFSTILLAISIVWAHHVFTTKRKNDWIEEWADDWQNENWQLE